MCDPFKRLILLHETILLWLIVHLWRHRKMKQRQQITKVLEEQEEKISRALADIQLSRRYQQKRFNTIAALHHSKVDRFLALEADAYATKIQAAYRGYRIRRQLAAQRSYEKRNSAAILVQRAVSLIRALISTSPGRGGAHPPRRVCNFEVRGLPGCRKKKQYKGTYPLWLLPKKANFSNLH